METHKTILFVTHSVEEAVYLGDRVIVMHPQEGKIAKINIPIYTAPPLTSSKI